MGTTDAVDLNAGEIRWKKTLGEYPRARKRPPQTGTENFGGTIVTAGGLVFIGGTKDEKFHAFDSATGKLLWEHNLAAGGYAAPAPTASTASSSCDRRGRRREAADQSGDAFVAFALPGSAGSK